MEYTPSDFLEINPETAAAHGLESGDPVRVESRRGAITVPAQVTDRVGPNTVFAPIHFAETAVNRLTDEEHLDPSAATPEYKVSAVRIAPAEDGQASEGAPPAEEPDRRSARPPEEE